jgi:peptidoglycan-N-acetylglucosamine deacetylase
MPKIRLFWIVVLLFVVMTTVVAQEAPERPTIIRNLLENPGFESPFADSDDAVLTRDVAAGWTPYNLAPNIEYPIFEPATLNSPDRIFEGEDAQKYVGFLYSEFNAGVYQVVTGLEPDDYTFSVKAYVWSSDDETQRDVSAQPCGTTVEVGIDPTGGEDASAEGIVWSEAIEACDEYTTHTVTTTVEGGTATVFVRAVANEARVLTEVYLDDAVLTVAGADEGGIIPQAATEEADAGTQVAAVTEETDGEAGLGTEEAFAVTDELDVTREIIPNVTLDTGTEENDLGILTETEQVTPEAPILTEEVPLVTSEALPTEEAPVATMEILPTDEIVPRETVALPTDDVSLTQTADADLLGTNTALLATANAGLTAESALQDANATGVIGTATTLAETQVAVDAQGTNDANAAQTVAPTQPVPSSPTFTITPEGQVATAPATTDAQGTEEADAERDISLSEQFPSQILHTVQYGDTVSILAARYGSAIQAIIEANGLNENALIYVGQGLVIPVRTPPVPTATATLVVTNAPTQIPPGDVYIVQPGDTLSQIARRFNTTVRTLAQLNGIVNVNSIRVGQRLQLVGTGTSNPPATQIAPTAVPSETTYTVQPGDSLYRIAIQYRVTIARLAEVNLIENPNRIFVGQRLVIPAPQS